MEGTDFVYAVFILQAVIACENGGRRTDEVIFLAAQGSRFTRVRRRTRPQANATQLQNEGSINRSPRVILYNIYQKFI